MTALRTAAQQALEAMEYSGMDVGKFNRINAACQALRAALAEPVQEPVAYSEGRTLHWHKGKGVNDAQLYLAPPQRKPLSEEDIKRIDDSTHFHESPDWSLRFARAVERAHGIT